MHTRGCVVVVILVPLQSVTQMVLETAAEQHHEFLASVNGQPLPEGRMGTRLAQSACPVDGSGSRREKRVDTMILLDKL